MKEKITQKFDELIKQGRELISNIGRESNGRLRFWINEPQIPLYQTWLFSASNLIRVVAPKDSHYFDECNRLVTHEDMATGISSRIVQKMFGLLISAQTEWSKGMLKEIEYVIAAETFDDFLDHADSYHKAGKKIEASVLASAVLEDTIKKIAVKNSIKTKGRTLDPLIDDLKAAGVFTPVKVKRVKAYAGVRNKADHAEWDEFDIKDVGEMIEGIRELIEKFL